MEIKVKMSSKNKVFEIFLIKITEEYTKGNYELIRNNKETEYEYGTIGDIIIFET
jgi:hypothetical protein